MENNMSTLYDDEEITSVKSINDVSGVVFARMTKELEINKLDTVDAENIWKDVLLIEKT